MSTVAAYDVIVVGAGSMGMSAGYYLARKGLRTLLSTLMIPRTGKAAIMASPADPACIRRRSRLNGSLILIRRGLDDPSKL